MRRFLLALLLVNPVWAQPESLLRRLEGLYGPELKKAVQAAEADLPQWPPGPQRARFFRVRAEADPENALDYCKAAASEPDLSPEERLVYRVQWAQALLKAGRMEEYRDLVTLTVAELPAQPGPRVSWSLDRLSQAEAARRSDPLPRINSLLAAPKDFYACSDLMRWYETQKRPDGVEYWWGRAREVSDGSLSQLMELWRMSPPAQESQLYTQLTKAIEQLEPAQQNGYLLRIAVSLGLRRPVDSARIRALLEPTERFDGKDRLDAEEILARHLPQQALEHTRNALALAQELKEEDSRRISRLQFNLAATLEETGQNEEALGAFQRGLEYALQHEPEECWRFFSRTLDLARSLKRADQEEKLSQLILSSMQRLPAKQRVDALELLLPRGDLSQKLALATQVRQAYQEELNQARRGQDWDQVAWLGRHLSSLWRRLGEPRSSRQLLEDLLKDPLSQVQREMVTEDLLWQLVAMHDEEALEARATALMGGPFRAIGLRALAEAALRRKDYAAALSYAESLPRVESLQMKLTCYEYQGRYDQALAILDELDKEPQRSHYKKLSSALKHAEWTAGSVSQMWLGKAFALLLERPGEGEVGSYFFLLRRRQLEWVPQLEELALAMTPEQRQDLYVQTALSLGPDHGGKEWLIRAGSLPAGLQAQVRKVFGGSQAPAAPQEPLGAVLDQVRLARPELGNLLTLRSTNIQPLQNHLQKGECLVSYVSTGVDLLVVFLTSDRADYFRIAADPTQLQQQVAQDWQRLSRHQPVALEYWSKKLVRPVLERIHPTRLLVVPSGDLWKLPFQALSEVPTAQLTSGDLLRLADGDWKPFRLQGALVGMGAPPEADLPGALDELQLLASQLPQATVWTGKKATASRLLGFKKPIQLLHLATHTRYQAKDPLQSSVQLHQSQLLLSQLHQLSLAPRSLAVLSSCRGGLGQDNGGSEPVSLATALDAAGAQTVIANLWDADDQASLVFFRTFYARLQAGSELSQAFQAARADCRAKYPDPFYWAGFCLLGNPR